MKTLRHFLGIYGVEKKFIDLLLDYTEDVKKHPLKYSSAAKGKTLIMYFEKPSTRTRLSFEIGFYQLGGQAIYFGADSHLARGKEDIHDTAKVISRYAHLFMARVYKHSFLEQFSLYSEIPVINGLSDLEHPCQAIADVFTIKEKVGFDSTLAYVGDGNNVANSLMMAAAMVGIKVKIATPKGYEPERKFVEYARKFGKVELYHDPKEAVKDADVVYTDVWVSMGQEAEKEKRMEIFSGFKVTQELMDLTNNAIFMHCLPAMKGYEVEKEVIEGKSSVVFDQAENRLHTQKALMIDLLEAA